MTLNDPIQITDRGDPRIAPFIGVRERDLNGGTDGRFIVEGKVPLSILLTRSRFEVESLFLCETRLEPLAEILGHLADGVAIYTASQGLMDEIAGFPIHRGVLACARKGEGLLLDALINPLAPPSPESGRRAGDEGIGLEVQDKSDAAGIGSLTPNPSPANRERGTHTDATTLLVLNQISNHDNVGAAFRNAAAFGADGVILDEQSCDPLYRKAIRVSSGSALWLPYHQGGTGLDHIAALKAEGYTIWAMTPRAEALPLHEMDVPDRLAILLGAEGPGLPDTLIESATPVRIPMIERFDSLNVATAGAIALAKVFSSRQG